MCHFHKRDKQRFLLLLLLARIVTSWNCLHVVTQQPRICRLRDEAEDSLVTATWRLDLPSSITSMTSSGLETKRSVHPWERCKTKDYTLAPRQKGDWWETRRTNLDKRHPVLVLVHRQVGLRHWKQGRFKWVKAFHPWVRPQWGKKRCGNTHRPAGHGFCPCRFQNKRPGREEKKSLVPQSGEEEERCCPRESSADLDVEFQVLIHGKDVVENVLGDTGDDAHQVRVVQLALQSQSESHLCFKQQQLKAKKRGEAFLLKCLYSQQKLSSRTYCLSVFLLVVFYLHGVSLPGGGLSVCENGAIVSTQNI